MITVGNHKAVIVKGDYAPAELWLGKSHGSAPNNGTKIAGWHEAETGLPGSIRDTYNDAIAITALGRSVQQTYAATETYIGNTVNLTLPPGQPLDVTVIIEVSQSGSGEPSPQMCVRYKVLTGRSLL